MLDEVWGRSNLRPPLSWLQFGACDVAVGFRPQLHAAAAIAAQTELRWPSFDKQKKEIKTNNWTEFFVRFVTQAHSFTTFASDHPLALNLQSLRPRTNSYPGPVASQLPAAIRVENGCS